MAEVNHVYYNFLIHNGTDEPMEASFYEDRNEALLKQGSEYELTVSRFSIPSVSIPLFIWKPNIYYVGLQATVNSNINWIEVRLMIPNIFEHSDTPWGDPYDDTVGKERMYVYSYQVWVDCLNYAFTNLWNQTAGFDVDNAPSVTYLGDDNISIVVPFKQDVNGVDRQPYPGVFSGTNQSDDDSDRIWMSRQLYLQFFPSHDADKVLNNNQIINPQPAPAPPTPELGKDKQLFYRLRFSQTYGNVFTHDEKVNTYPNLTAPVDYIESVSQYPATFSWTKVRRIILASNALQINNESIGASRQGIPYTQSLLADFELPIENHPLNRHTIYYQPSVFRWISIITDSEIRKMDLRIYFQTFDDLQVYPLMLPPGFEVNVKIAFRKKEQTPSLIKRLLKVLEEEHSRLEHVALSSQYIQRNTGDAGFRIGQYSGANQKIGGFLGLSSSK